MKKTLVLLTTGLVLLTSGSVFAQGTTAKAKAHANNIVETAVNAGTFKTLAKALTAADLISTLEGKGPFTVFAPTDAAFAKIPKATLDKLLKDKVALKKVLLYHVVAGKVTAKDVMKMSTGKTVEGDTVKITVKGKKVMINNANVTKADIKTSNGLIHVIDTVLMPPTK